MGKIEVTVVFNVSKILKRKQITTIDLTDDLIKSCFQCFKDTKKKANHNYDLPGYSYGGVVFNVSKILKRKQITTMIHQARK